MLHLTAPCVGAACRASRPLFCRTHRAAAAKLAPPLALLCLFAWACSDSTYDVCARAITKQAACDPNLATAAETAVSACTTQLDAEAPSCREAARRLADCVAQANCAETDRLCTGGVQMVQFNCNQSPFLEPEED